MEHNNRDLARAFNSFDKEQWTESQRRVAMRVEWLEKTVREQTQRLARFEKAAAESWLREQEVDR